MSIFHPSTADVRASRIPASGPPVTDTRELDLGCRDERQCWSGRWTAGDHRQRTGRRRVAVTDRLAAR